MAKPMTYQSFLLAFEPEMDVLEVFDKNGFEVECEEFVPALSPVIGYTRRGSWFGVQLDI